MHIKTILITGSTAGIGKEAAMQLAESGHKLILLSRDVAKLNTTKSEIVSKTGNKNIDTIVCNLESQKSIRTAAQEIREKYPVIDVLINNAGINTAKHELTEDGIEKTFAINHLAYFLLTGLLLENITRSPQGRIINVSSNGHLTVDLDIDKIRNNEYKGRYTTYRRSKLANVMFTIDLAEKLNSTNVTVNCLHPGLINTNIGVEDRSPVRKLLSLYKRRFAKSPAKGADTIVYLATANEVAEITGKYFVNRKVKRPSTKTGDVKNRYELWKLSEEMTKFRYLD